MKPIFSVSNVLFTLLFHSIVPGRLLCFFYICAINNQNNIKNVTKTIALNKFWWFWCAATNNRCWRVPSFRYPFRKTGIIFMWQSSGTPGSSNQAMDAKITQHNATTTAHCRFTYMWITTSHSLYVGLHRNSLMISDSKYSTSVVF